MTKVPGQSQAHWGRGLVGAQTEVATLTTILLCGCAALGISPSFHRNWDELHPSPAMDAESLLLLPMLTKPERHTNLSWITRGQELSLTT